MSLASPIAGWGLHWAGFMIGSIFQQIHLKDRPDHGLPIAGAAGDAGV